MSILRLSPRARNAVADIFTALIDAGDGPGTLSIYTGPMPPNAGAELTGQELLGVLTFGRPPAAASEIGIAAFSGIVEESSAGATGRAVWARIRDADRSTVFDCDVTDPGGGGALINADGDLVLQFSDDTAATIGRVRGRDGIDAAPSEPPAPPAPPTPPAAGPQGRGIVHAMIDADGNLVLVYSDETSQVVGRVRGRDGAPPVPAPPAAIPSVAAPVPTRRLVEFVRDPATGQLMSGIITDSPEAT